MLNLRVYCVGSQSRDIGKIKEGNLFKIRRTRSRKGDSGGKKIWSSLSLLPLHYYLGAYITGYKNRGVSRNKDDERKDKKYIYIGNIKIRSNKGNFAQL